jgi:photosystem II stability/assembly factor-like uncharacterized protein
MILWENAKMNENHIAGTNLDHEPNGHVDKRPSRSVRRNRYLLWSFVAVCAIVFLCRNPFSLWKNPLSEDEPTPIPEIQIVPDLNPDPVRISPLTSIYGNLPKAAPAIWQIAAVRISDGRLGIVAALNKTCGGFETEGENTLGMYFFKNDHWELVADPLVANSCLSLLTANHGRGILYAKAEGGNIGSAILRSYDGGETWELMPGWKEAVDLDVMAIYVPDDGTILFGTEHDVYLSSDDGKSWGQLSIPKLEPSDRIWLHGVNPGDGREILVEITENTQVPVPDRDELFLTFDQGKTWSDPIPPGKLYYDIDLTHQKSDQKDDPLVKLLLSMLRPASSNTLWKSKVVAGRLPSLLYSHNDGMEWSEISTLPDDIFLRGDYAVIMKPIDDQVVVLGTPRDGVLLTEDGAASWRRLNEGLPEIPRNMTAFAIRGDSSSRILYVALEQLIFRSDDDGENWISLGSTGDKPIIGLLPLDGDTEILALREADLVPDSSTPSLVRWSKERWEELPQSPPLMDYGPRKGQPLLRDPWNPELIYALTNGTVYRSGDQGDSWEEISLPSSRIEHRVDAMSFDLSAETILILSFDQAPGYHQNVFYLSEDHGRSWERIPIASYIWAVDYSHKWPRRIYYETTVGEIGILNPSWDGYQVLLENGSEPIVVIPTQPEALLFTYPYATPNGVAIVCPGDPTWYLAPWPEGTRLQDVGYPSIIVDPILPSGFYVLRGGNLFWGTVLELPKIEG